MKFRLSMLRSAAEWALIAGFGFAGVSGFSVIGSSDRNIVAVWQGTGLLLFLTFAARFIYLFVRSNR